MYSRQTLQKDNNMYSNAVWPVLIFTNTHVQGTNYKNRLTLSKLYWFSFKNNLHDVQGTQTIKIDWPYQNNTDSVFKNDLHMYSRQTLQKDNNM